MLLRHLAALSISVCAVLMVPSLARADMTIGNSGNSGVTVTNTCTFTATTATASVSLAGVESCLNTAGKTTTIVDDIAGGGNVVFPDTVMATSCSGGTLAVDSDEGGVMINASIDLGGEGCVFAPEASDGDITQTTSSATTITADDAVYPRVSGAGDTLQLDSSTNAIASFGSSLLAGGVSLSDAEPLTIDTIASDAGPTSFFTVPDGIVVAGSITASGLLALTSDDGTVNETSSGSSAGTITASVLELESSVPAINSLTDANDVGGLIATTGGSLDFTNVSAGGLELGQVMSENDLTVASTGNLTLVGGSGEPDVDAAGPMSLTSSTGSIAETGSGAIQAAVDTPALTLSAPEGELTFTAANQVGTLTASAGDGAIDFANAVAPLTLSSVSASGAVTVTNASEPIDLSGTVAGRDVSLSGSSFGGTGGQLSAPGVQLSDSTAGDGWTVSPGSVTDGANGAIPFSGASGLSITGGDSFDVTASNATTFTFAGGSPAAGTLDYNAQGRVVTGSTAAPSGEIDSTTVDPVDYSGMTAVNLTDLGTAPPASPIPTSSAPTATTPTSSAPTAPTSTSPTSPTSTAAAATSCRLRAPRSRVSVPKSPRQGRRPPATLRLTLTCTASAHVVLSGQVTVSTITHPKPGAKKTTTRRYGIKAITATVGPSLRQTVTIDIPTAVVSALTGHHTVSATLGYRYSRGDGKTAAGSLTLKALT
jgi:hypothetical protein